MTPFPATFPVLLAPMAGVTDLPFRRLVQGFGAGLVVSEMVASGEIVTGGAEARLRAELGLGGPGDAGQGAAGAAGTAVQLAGRAPGPMAEAARLVEANGARLIDINMGCPAKKVTGGLSGAALLRDLDLALAIIRAVVAAVAVPVTLKTRLGWDRPGAAVELARRAEAEGVRMVTVHGRTRTQFYEGRADWAAIRAVREAVTVPVVANGDIADAASARAALAASGAAGVMVGRGAEGRPWALAEIAAALGHGRRPEIPSGAALADLAGAHVEASMAFHGAEVGLRTVRKHLRRYLEGAGTPPDLARSVLTAGPAEIFPSLRDAFPAGAPRRAAA